MCPNQTLEVSRQALREATAALDVAEAAGEPARLSQALAHLSRCHRQLGALAEAVWCAKRGLQLARSLSAVDATVDALCELVDLAVERAAMLDAQDESRGAHHLRDTARDHAFEAVQLALRSADPRWEVTVLLRVSDLFDALGDHDDAIALQCRAVELLSGASHTGGAPAPMNPSIAV
jgi:tetratricopeptide (TPR) repeat protein